MIPSLRHRIPAFVLERARAPATKHWARINSISINDFWGSDLIYDCTCSEVPSTRSGIERWCTWMKADAVKRHTLHSRGLDMRNYTNFGSSASSGVDCCFGAWLLGGSCGGSRAGLMLAIKFAFCTTVTTADSFEHNRWLLAVDEEPPFAEQTRIWKFN